MSLADLIAKNKAKKEATRAQPVSGESAQGNGTRAAQPADVGTGNDSGSSRSVPSTAAAATATTGGAKLRFGSKKPAGSTSAGDNGLGTGGAGSGERPAASPTPVTESTSVAKRFAGFKAGGGNGAPASVPVRSPSDSGQPDKPLGGLAALAESTAGQPLERRPSMFADEVAATAPLRELPVDITAQQQNFIKSLDSVYEVVHEPDMLGKVIRTIMLELQENPEYRKLIQPLDVRTMIKGMRDSMGMARVKKQEKKRGSGGGAKPSKAVDEAMLADLDGLLESEL